MKYAASLVCILLFNCMHLHSQMIWVVQPSFAPIEKTVVLSNNLNLKYVEHGNANGLPVVFIHGYSDSRHSYDSVLPLLPHNIRAIAITLRGHGNSDKPSSGYSPAHFSKDLASLIKKLDLGPVVVVGHSLGGLIAQRFAIDHPELTRSLVICASTAGFGSNEVVKEFHTLVMKLTDPIDSLFAVEFQKSTLAKPIDEKHLALLCAESRKLPAHAWKEIMQQLLKTDLTPELKKIKTPTLIVWGDQDGFCTKSQQLQLKNGINNSELKIYPGLGHALHWEEPRLFVKDLLEFIEKKK